MSFLGSSFLVTWGLEETAGSLGSLGCASPVPRVPGGFFGPDVFFGSVLALTGSVSDGSASRLGFGGIGSAGLVRELDRGLVDFGFGLESEAWISEALFTDGPCFDRGSVRLVCPARGFGEVGRLECFAAVEEGFGSVLLSVGSFLFSVGFFFGTKLPSSEGTEETRFITRGDSSKEAPAAAGLGMEDFAIRGREMGDLGDLGVLPPAESGFRGLTGEFFGSNT